MKYVTLGNTGVEVSRIGLGGFAFGAVNRARGWDPYTDEGRADAVRVILHAVERGINYIDTAESYGDGHSEGIIGEALGRLDREELFIATKFHMDKGPDEIRASVRQSLRRLNCGHLDLVQFHGGAYGPEAARSIVEDGPADALADLREEGVIRFVGATTSEAHSLLPLLRADVLDVVQVRYNLIYQAAAHHLLNEARERGAGVVLMRPMTSGMLQWQANHLLPELAEGCDLYEVCLKFVLADSRVHVAHVGMRWPEEVDRNVALVDRFEPAVDVAEMPRSTRGIYDYQDGETT
ncbi:MAG: aldo/keto reductase [Planctomycetota bacterium]